MTVMKPQVKPAAALSTSASKVNMLKGTDGKLHAVSTPSQRSPDPPTSSSAFSCCP
jgi:hypothetical protein